MSGKLLDLVVQGRFWIAQLAWVSANAEVSNPTIRPSVVSLGMSVRVPKPK